MMIYVALLRGINVGGHNKVKMADLKRLFETMGFGKVQTYIQSGNVLFESEEGANLVQQRIEQEFSEVFAFSVPVILRTAMELEGIIRDCPFQTDALTEGESLNLAFLSEVPSEDAINHLLTFRSDVEECEIEGKDVYLFLRQSIRNSKLSIHLQKLGVSATIRNWRTINKLATMAKAMGD
jgi:uncharacterized protein (DUF1697 family)